MGRVFKISILLLILTACGDEIVLPETSELLVVEGWLTDRDSIQQVRLSKTVSFESEITSTGVTGAEVTIKSLQNDFPFIHSGNGIYQSVSPFSGVSGRLYWIEIELDGELITSERERMRSVPALDSIYYDFFERPSEENPQIEEIIYYPIGYFSDQLEEQNFYRWRFKKNDILFNQPEDIFIQEDRFFNGLDSIKNEFTGFEYKLNDTIYMEVQEISFEAYNYLRLLRLQTTSLGTRNGTTPSVVRGNLTNTSNPGNLILGYFGVVSMTSDTTIINP